MTTTPKTHKLKTWPEYFSETWSGRKPFEVRSNDRDFGTGDVLLLREYDLDSGDPGSYAGGPFGHYTGREMTAEVTYVLHGGQFGIAMGTVVLGLKVLQRSGASARLPKERADA
jgi:uncharacterized protein DUF3850